MAATTTGFADYLSTKWQTVLLTVAKKEKPLVYPRLMKVTDMDTNPWLSVKISGLGQMPQKPEGQQFAFQLPIAGGNFQVLAVPFGMGYSVTYEMWRDDLYGVMMEMWYDEGRSARFRQEVQGHLPWNQAFSTATGYDNTALCSTSHTDLDGSIQSNRSSPDITLSQTLIQAGQLNFRLLNDDTSRPYYAEPTRLLIHPLNIPLARELLGSQGKSQSVMNDMNALLPDELSWIPSRFLTRTQDVFLMQPIEESDCEFMWRDRPKARSFDDPFTDAADFTMYQRMVPRVGDWRWIYGSSVGT